MVGSPGGNALGKGGWGVYGLSVLHWLTQSLAHDGAGLGTCWGEAKARALVHERSKEQDHACQQLGTA
jgi:hypothetical protein